MTLFHAMELKYFAIHSLCVRTYDSHSLCAAGLHMQNVKQSECIPFDSYITGLLGGGGGSMAFFEERSIFDAG